MHSHSSPVMRPSLRMPIFSRISVSGRPRWVMKVSSRLTTRRTQPPALRASKAAINSTFSVSVRQPKTAADMRLDHADSRHVYVENLRQHQVHVIGHLGGGMNGHAIAHRVVIGDGGVHFHLVLTDLGAIVDALAH